MAAPDRRHSGTIRKRIVTPNQLRGFWAAWGGWTLDGMDSFIYALVLVPALRELLPHSGIVPSTANVGYYGGLLFALFLVGWGLSLLWGPIADRFGRVRVLALTILSVGAPLVGAPLWASTRPARTYFLDTFGSLG